VNQLLDRPQADPGQTHFLSLNKQTATAI
jgi:hypothetical protein